MSELYNQCYLDVNIYNMQGCDMIIQLTVSGLCGHHGAPVTSHVVLETPPGVATVGNPSMMATRVRVIDKR